ncbi:MAG: hypothetical protein M3Z65_00960 [Chloroflexota bacterium]|nr:hypothetical protein [Chloroflexota bacterium]
MKSLFPNDQLIRSSDPRTGLVHPAPSEAHAKPGAAGASPKIVFGTDGWRARIADEYTFDAVRACARCR